VQEAVAIVHRHGKAVQLQLRYVAERLASQQLADAAVEVAQFGLVERIVEAEHGRAVPDLDETLARLAADALGGRVCCGQFRMRGLQFAQPAHQPVVFGVGDFGPVEDVVEVLVAPQLRP